MTNAHQRSNFISTLEVNGTQLLEDAELKGLILSFCNLCLRIPNLEHDMEAIYPSALTIDKESVDDPFREEVGG